MLKIFKKKAPIQTESVGKAGKLEQSKKKGWLNQLTYGLQKTRHHFTEQLSHALLGKKKIDDALIEEIETLLLTADVGIETSQYLINTLTQTLSHKELNNDHIILNTLKEHMTELLAHIESPFHVTSQPYVILMVGVNGAGKTTTIGKLAKLFQQQGKSVMLAAGDTFRAAAIEQLQAWGERNQIPVIAQESGADSASVIFDAVQSATAKKMDVIIADTAGRLHTQSNLMEELKKIKRVISKINPDAPHQVMLILDACIGQNALHQAKQFNEAIGVTSLILTKLDGTAKGGIIFAIAKELGIPIHFIGVGEQIDDLQPFHAEEFVDALFAENS